MTDIQKLKVLAEAATQGEWTCSDKHDGRFWHIGCGNQAIGSTHAASKKANPSYAEMFEANAKFIAAANPAAVLALINERSIALWQLDIQRDIAARRYEEIEQIKAECEGLREAVRVSIDCFEKISSSDGSGHADLAGAVLRIAGSAFSKDGTQ